MIQYIIAAGIGAFLGSQSKKSKKSYAHGGEIKPTSYQESDNGIYEVKMSDGEIVIVDFSLEDFEEQRNKKDIFAQAKRNYEPSTYAHGGSIREIISNPHKPPFRIIIDKNGNEYVYRQWADNNIPYLIPYTIRNEEAYTDRQKSYFWSHHNIPKDTWIDVRSIKDFSIYPLSKKEFEELRNAKMQSNNKAYENVLEKYHNSFKKGGSTYAEGGEIKIYVDKDDEPIKVVKGLNNAKKWVLKNKRYHDEIVVEDEALDSIVVDKTDTIKDIDWLFNPTYAKGGKTHIMPDGSTMLDSDHYAKGGKTRKNRKN